MQISFVFKHHTLATSSLSHNVDKWVGFLWPQPQSEEQLVPLVAELVFAATSPPPVWVIPKHREPRKFDNGLSDSYCFTGVRYTWNICRCNEGILVSHKCSTFMNAMQEFYEGSLLFHGAHTFMQLRRELYAVCFVCILFFRQLIPLRRFLEVCTSSYHALTCDYR